MPAGVHVIMMTMRVHEFMMPVGVHVMPAGVHPYRHCVAGYKHAGESDMAMLVVDVGRSGAYLRAASQGR